MRTKEDIWQDINEEATKLTSIQIKIFDAQNEYKQVNAILDKLYDELDIVENK